MIQTGSEDLIAILGKEFPQSLPYSMLSPSPTSSLLCSGPYIHQTCLAPAPTYAPSYMWLLCSNPYIYACYAQAIMPVMLRPQHLFHPTCSYYAQTPTCMPVMPRLLHHAMPRPQHRIYPSYANAPPLSPPSYIRSVIFRLLQHAR